MIKVHFTDAYQITRLISVIEVSLDSACWAKKIDTTMTSLWPLDQKLTRVKWLRPKNVHINSNKHSRTRRTEEAPVRAPTKEGASPKFFGTYTSVLINKVERYDFSFFPNFLKIKSHVTGSSEVSVNSARWAECNDIYIAWGRGCGKYLVPIFYTIIVNFRRS